MEDDSCVRVAVRIRPQIPREVIDMCRVCTSVTPNEPQVWLGSDKAFTFDDVFDMDSVQDNVYSTCVQELIEGCLEGYNATVLAYGQTGSGKTYTMGTVFEVDIPLDEYGIIPRAVHHLFESIKERQSTAHNNRQPIPEFQIHCQFIEIYNEEIIDLFDNAREIDSKNRRSQIKIHEDPNGAIYMVGVLTQNLTSEEETIRWLRRGALSRTTATTQMNVSSSRSHAIFTLVIKQQRIVLTKDPDFDIDTADDLNEFETLTAKFHFVDLAGSERLKRTGATGDRAKEAISINCGLLALGNVISALGDKLKKGSHVPYRDSKLTRLLQDSLGGNSRTLMIACISPSDRDFMETLNTLKYANRARNIKNRVTINQDKTSRTITSLRVEIQMLQLELLEYKQGKRVIVDGVESVNDMFHENTMLQTESNNLRTRVKAMQETIETLTVKNVELLAEKTSGIWITSGGDHSDIGQLIQTYLKDIEELRAKLLESEHTCEILRRNAARSQTRLSMSPMHGQLLTFSGDVDDAGTLGVIEEAKRDLLNLQRTIRSRTKSGSCEKGEVPENEDRHENDDDYSNEVEDESSDFDSEEDEQYRADLADITCEISIKQKLIDELELNQKRIQTLRKQYEEKLLQLQNKIKATQEERDRVLANLGLRDDHSGEKSQKIKAEYEKKLADMQSQLNKLHLAKKQHAKLAKHQSEYEKQMKTLKTELAEMKKTKVRLMNKIKEEASRHKELEMKRNREIAQLKKESRVKENQIRTMEAASKLKDTVLRRKHEEVNALRKGAKPMSDRVAGRLHRPVDKGNVRHNRPTIFSPKVAKSKWQHLEKDITKCVLNKQTIANIENDMESALKDREILRGKLEKYMKKKERSVLLDKDYATIHELEEHIENLSANIDYVQERISDSQAHIIQIEESKDAKDILDSTTLLADLNFEEVKYVVDKLLAMTISQGLTAAQKGICLKEMEAKFAEVTRSNLTHQQLLEHMLVQNGLNFSDVLNLRDSPVSSESATSTRSTSPVGSIIQQLDDIVIPVPLPPARPTDKARRRTATPQELLYVKNESENNFAPTIENIQEEESLYQKIDPKPYSTTYNYQRHASVTVNKIAINITQPNSHDNTPAPTPPLSPTPSLRRLARDGNVFSRLTAGESKMDQNDNNRGRIAIACNNNRLAKVDAQLSLVHTHTAEGHAKAVLSVAADENILLSASKDRTVKIWDLHKGEEIGSLGGHPNNVISVRYSSRDQLAFSVSSSFIKLWDIRSNTCIKTLSSSGITTNGEVQLATPSRTLQMPNGESQINDIIFDERDSILYSAASSSVRVWDLRKYQCVGKLSGGHQTPVMCLAVGDNKVSNTVILTGCKDHYIRLFDVCGDIAGIHTPRLKLEPPHYDGIEALTIVDDVLFSGSRDACIKKWDLNSKKAVHSISKAHKDWVCGLIVMPSRNSVLSCCRSGYLKQWRIDDCKLVGEVKAPKQVNGIAKNSSAIFTASEDGTIGIWRQS